ncbi:hypothetical protein Cni_G01344 [Canna indica]|uniref:Uncharacterized protein n=1 Tax=Canna indica TaxID=4628 RepID=A0AAQ3JP10_9LILI|nr:hypothetical protein Cni_G01344 [Canna indica]
MRKDREKEGKKVIEQRKQGKSSLSSGFTSSNVPGSVLGLGFPSSSKEKVTLATHQASSIWSSFNIEHIIDLENVFFLFRYDSENNVIKMLSGDKDVAFSNNVNSLTSFIEKISVSNVSEHADSTYGP